MFANMIPPVIFFRTLTSRHNRQHCVASRQPDGPGHPAGDPPMPNSASTRIVPFPREFKVKTIAANGAKIHVRVGGKGPAVVLLHGFGETGDMWAPLAAQLVP